MRWKLLVILGVVLSSFQLLPSFEQTTQEYSVKNPQGGESYSVNYSLTGAVVNDMSINTQETSLVILMNSTADGNMVIDLPRTLIDAKAGSSDDQFIVLVDDTYASFHEKKTDTDRTITIPFTAGSSRIEIIGTQVVPEFGPLTAFVFAASLLSLIVVSTRLKFGSHQSK